MVEVKVHIDPDDEYGVSLVREGVIEHFSDIFAADRKVMKDYLVAIDGSANDYLLERIELAGVLCLNANRGNIFSSQFFAAATALGIPTYRFGE